MKWFEFLLPALWRQRPASNPELNDAILARLADTDPVYRALMDHAYSLFEEATLAGLEPKLSGEERAYLAGRANGLLAYLTVVQRTAERAREQRLAAEAATAARSKRRA